MVEKINSPYFSVVMPVYNSEKYLRRSIESVLNQTYSNFELIIIDDCSDDGSFGIITEYQKKDSRIIAFRTKQNLGVSNARNEGIRQAHGRYLTFVDSDDYIESELFSKVKEVIDSTGAQLVKYSIVEQYYDRRGVYIGDNEVIIQDGVYSTFEDVRKQILRISPFGYLWNGFYDIKIVPKYLWNFDVRWRINEDFRMNMKIIGYISKMACMSYIGYHYEKRGDVSLSSKKNSQYYQETKVKPEIYLESYTKWGLLTDDIRKEIYWRYIRVVYSAICRALKQGGWISARKTLNQIYEDRLFKRFVAENIHVSYASIKQEVMRKILSEYRTDRVLLLCFLINFFQDHFRILFAKIKE